MATIMIVDDDSALRKVIRQMIELSGHTAIEAENGKAALKSFREQRPDIVLSDIVMPQMDGIEAIVELRREAPDLRVIAMSGGGRVRNLDVLRVAKRAGADAILAKPFTLADLTKALDELLGKA